ncbi:MAG TPA: hypothetical protein VFL45_06075 [Gammaproteobacteria bacterium]|nr:hypothetical protein [Gammaproteobacteria bacterium]
MRQLAPFLVLLTTMATAPAAAAPKNPAVPFLRGLGDHHHPITTSVPTAQRYFDQGLILAFGFNHAEALRSFRAAQQLDPDCAMCYWGEALVLGPNINAAMDPADNPQAYAALQKALMNADGASERERAYIQALTARYAPQAPEDRAPLDRAYAEAMRQVASRYPEDLDAQVLYAEALMDTTPWHYWQPDGKPTPATKKVLAVLNAVLKQNPAHPMANHLYIHAVEDGHPEWGLDAAKRLETLVPGIGHLVHMPSHIYIRTGDYHSATLTNQHAIDADRKYLAQVNTQGGYRLVYVPHNYHFLWASATLEGRSHLAIQAARDMSAAVDTGKMRQPGLTSLQHYWITPLYALVRFGRWDRIMAWPEPADDLVYPRGVWHYARGMALTRKDKIDGARRELAALKAVIDDPRLAQITVWGINSGRHILRIARHALAGELAAATGDYPSAIGSLKQAVKLEDALNYDEPPTWHYPTRQSLGAVLLKAGRAAEAAEIYRQDLDVFPKNGWSLYGLLQAMRRQGKEKKARDVAARFRQAWQYADVTLTASRF